MNFETIKILEKALKYAKGEESIYYMNNGLRYCSGCNLSPGFGHKNECCPVYIFMKIHNYEEMKKLKK